MSDASARTREIARLAAPIVLGQISHVLVGLADTIMVARTGQAPLAALGFAAPVFLVGFLFFSSLFQGTQTVCARRLGQERLKETGTVLSSALVVGIIVGIPASLCGIFLPGPLMSALSTDDATATIASDYLQYRWGGGMWLIVLAFAFRGFYWGIGLTRIDLFVSLLFNLANIALNWVFIFGHLGAPAMGAAGAGLASALANLLSVITFFALTMGPKMREVYGTFRHRANRKIAGQVMRLSAPRSMQALAFSQAIVFFKIVGDHTGQAGLAASAVVWRFIGFTVLVSLGIGTATATLVGRELGAGRKESAARYGWTATGLGVLTVTVFAILFAMFREPLLLMFFSRGPNVTEASALTSDQLVALAVGPFLLMLAFQVVDAVGIILSRALNGAGEVMYVMYAEFAVAWLICIPATFLGVYLLSDDPLLGAWWGWGAYCAAWAVAMAWRWRRGSWSEIEI
ncbi:MAG: MATE family efflux transporter [Planctomycetes bacterium]|nr:MATE family efflux transporter [Planctomycetota bacterium]